MQPPSFPTVGHEVSGTDWGVIYGPLGLMAAVFLLMLFLVWRWSRSDVKDALAREAAAVKESVATLTAERAARDAALTAERTRSDAAVKAERDKSDLAIMAARAELEEARSAFLEELRESTASWQAAVKAMAHEMSETTRSITDKYHDHAVALRAVLDTTQRRIGRRERGGSGD